MVFISPVGIANLAISHVGGTALVESFTESGEEARQIRTHYDQSRREVLEAYDWTFARFRRGAALHGDTISTTATDPWAGEWAFRYQYPDNCIRVRKIQNVNSPPDDASPFDIELSESGQEKTIFTDVEDAVVVYTADITDTPLFAPTFITAFALLLGSKIAFPLSGKLKLARSLFAEFRNTLPVATASDANERVEKPPRDADWIRDRG